MVAGFPKFSWPFLPGRQQQDQSAAEQKTGSRGENIAVSFLEKQGYTVLARNYRRRFGEIDIVAEEGGVLVFIEVKARKNNRYGNPFEAVDTRKQRKLSRMAQDYISRHKMEDRPARFDVVAVRLNPHSRSEVELIRDAFDFQE
ncbi:MAG: YraN family protein [Desulfobulbaceae bacterium]|nr:YraN family protein [Desulfobulbaceae bacterium]